METKAEQYYPTYKADERDILLVEFEEAQRIANGQTEVYGRVTNVLLGLITLAFTVLFDQVNTDGKVMTFLFDNSILFATLLFLFGAILLRYFVDLQQQITINARKVVTLRTLLGLDYGHIHLTLPNWRVEGATNPFVIKYFNGWLNFKTMPFWLLTITVNIVWWLVVKDRQPAVIDLSIQKIWISWYFGNILISGFYLFVFRSNLNDRHETIYLSLVKVFCSIFRIRLLDNFEYIIYRAKLSYLELDRLKVDYRKLQKMLTEIEDKDFYSHSGISFKALVRGFLSRFKFFRKKLKILEHGGSTINMQLSRSLFLPSDQNKYLRKIAELLLAVWINNQFSKDEILRLYIASVRYERNVLGLSKAVKYFFGNLRGRILKDEESFFLVERLSNITSSVNWDRVVHLTTRTTSKIDKESLRKLYDTQVREGRLRQ